MFLIGPPTTLSLRVVCETLSTVKYKWFEICVQLDIPYHKLMEFRKEDDSFAAAVNYWLNGNAASWKSVVAALKSSHVGETGLADRINKNYCQHQNTEQDNG